MSKGQINLLPPEIRRGLKMDLMVLALMKFMRAVLYSLVVMTVAGGGSAAWFWWQNTKVDVGDKAETDNQLRAFQGIKREIEQKNKLIGNLEKIQAERIVWTGLISELLKEVPPGVGLYSISLDQGGDSPLVEITGVADTRNTLVIFEQRLNGLPWVERVQSPRSNLLQAENPLFILVLVIDRGALIAATASGTTN